MSEIALNLQEVLSSLPPHVRLVAVSKFHPVERLQEAYDAGQRIFGESRAQELCAKQEVLPTDIEWHFIGHLQPNKVKYIAPFVSLIHAVDSAKLLREIEKQAAKANRCIDCLLQLHVAAEETKFGFTPGELLEMLAAGEWKTMQHVRVVGLMAMATNTDDEGQIAREFDTVNQVFATVKECFFADEPAFKERSMGMSSDYLIAQEHGSTMVRIGTTIFGERDYGKG